MSNVSILGAGSWGTALSILLGKKGCSVRLWDRNMERLSEMESTRENKRYLPNVKLPENIKFDSDIMDCIKDADAVVLGVPSHAVRDVCTAIKDDIKNGQIIISIAKGIENNTYMRMSQVIESLIPQCTVCVLSGPSHAEEVSRSMPTAVVSSSPQRTAAEYVQDLFMTPDFRVYTNPDIIGVELGGALKNIIALAAGICDGLGSGDNTKAALMTRGLAEMTRLGVAMGADMFTFAGLTGIGDLIVTCTSSHSRNRKAGYLIGKGMPVGEAVRKVKMVVEGIKTTKAAYELSKINNVNMPITEELYGILYKGKDVRRVVYELMTREKTIEMHEIEEIASKEKKGWKMA